MDMTIEEYEEFIFHPIDGEYPVTVSTVDALTIIGEDE